MAVSGQIRTKCVQYPRATKWPLSTLISSGSEMKVEPVARSMRKSDTLARYPEGGCFLFQKNDFHYFGRVVSRTFAIRCARLKRNKRMSPSPWGITHIDQRFSPFLGGWKGLRLIRFSFQSCHTAPFALATAVVCVCVLTPVFVSSCSRQIDSMNRGKENIDTQRSTCFTHPAVREEAGPTSQAPAEATVSGINADASIHPGPARHKRRIVLAPGAFSERKRVSARNRSDFRSSKNQTEGSADARRMPIFTSDSASTELLHIPAATTM